VPPIQRCTATVSANTQGATSIEIVHNGGKSRLHVTGGDCATTCVRMVVERGQTGALSMAAGKKYVHVNGKKWKAHANRVQICPDGRVLLLGNVKFLSDKVGVCTSVKADKLCVRVKQGCCDRIEGD
jgi:hypothetical protein